MKFIGWLLTLAFLAAACGVGQPVNLPAAIQANEAQARTIQTQVAQANTVIAAQQTQAAATMQAVATMFAPAVFASPTPAEEETSVSTPTPTFTPSPTPQPLHSLTFTTPRGIQLTLHRTWWALRVEDFTPTEGKVFLILDLTLHNPGEEPLQDYALPLYASVHTAQGYVFHPVPLPLTQQALEFVTLAPHDRRRGLLVFALYPDEGPFTLEIQDNPLDLWAKPVRVTLNPVPYPPTASPAGGE